MECAIIECDNNSTSQLKTDASTSSAIDECKKRINALEDLVEHLLQSSTHTDSRQRLQSSAGSSSNDTHTTTMNLSIIETQAPNLTQIVEALQSKTADIKTAVASIGDKLVGSSKSSKDMHTNMRDVKSNNYVKLDSVKVTGDDNHTELETNVHKFLVETQTPNLKQIVGAL